jgi:uncharacterized protein YciI
MFFLMECRHHPNQDAARDRLRPAHRDWVRSGGNGLVSVLIGSALWDEAGEAVGHWGVLEAAGAAEAHAFAEGDPYDAAGVVAQTTFTRLADSLQAERISERMTEVRTGHRVPELEGEATDT